VCTFALGGCGWFYPLEDVSLTCFDPPQTIIPLVWKCYFSNNATCAFNLWLQKKDRFFLCAATSDLTGTCFWEVYVVFPVELVLLLAYFCRSPPFLTIKSTRLKSFFHLFWLNLKFSQKDTLGECPWFSPLEHVLFPTHSKFYPLGQISTCQNYIRSVKILFKHIHLSCWVKILELKLSVDLTGPRRSWGFFPQKKPRVISYPFKN